MDKQPTLKIGEVELRVRPFTREDLEKLDEFVREHRRSPLEIAKLHLDGLSPELQERLLLEALRMEQPVKGVLSPLEYGFVLDTKEGAAFAVWLMARRDQPHLTVNDITDMVLAMTDKEFRDFIEQRNKVDAIPGGEGPADAGEGLLGVDEGLPDSEG